MSEESFEVMLTGGHPNSLGRTLEVVALVISNPDKIDELYGCYFSADEVVRLRTSNALKRISREHPDWLIPFIDRFIHEVARIDQASAQWTLAILFQTLKPYMTPDQRSGALAVLQHNLETHRDWIVLNNTMQTLAEWAHTDKALQKWLVPQLERLTMDPRKSVARKARKLLSVLS